MYLILISMGLASAVLGLFLALDMVGFDNPVSATMAVLSWSVTFVLSFALLGRRLTKGLDTTMKQVEKHLQSQKLDLALKTLRDAQGRYGRWHPLVSRQISSQIGQILYVRGRFEDAIPYLQGALRWDWTARAMLACAYHKIRQPDRMAAVFAKTAKVRTARKEPLFWTLYAYLLRKNGKKDKAAEVLQRALKYHPDDKRLANSLQAVQGNKRMKVKVYGPAWQQFRL